MDDSTSPPQSTQGRFLLVILLQSSPPQTIRLKVPSRSMQEEKGAPVVQCNLATMQIEATFSAQCKKSLARVRSLPPDGRANIEISLRRHSKEKGLEGEGGNPPLKKKSPELVLAASFEGLPLTPLLLVGGGWEDPVLLLLLLNLPPKICNLPSNPPTDASFPSRFHSIFAFASFRWRRPFNQDPVPFSGSPPKNRRLGKTGSGLSCRRDLFCLKSSAHGNENVIRLLIVVKDIGFQNNLELRRRNL